MLKFLKKTSALLLALIVFSVSVLGESTISYAGGTEQEGTSADISDVSFSTEIDEDGYYPASFQYAIRNMTLYLTFSDETTDVVSYWSAWEYTEDYKFVGYSRYYSDAYYMRFYDAEGNLVKITDDYVPIGEFTMKISRNSSEAFYTTTIKILDPEIVSVDSNTASFSSDDYKKYEETWYAINPEVGKEYVYKSVDWNINYASFFANIWIKNDDNSVTRINEGLNDYSSVGDTFSHIADGENQIYLAVGETYNANSLTGKIIWNEKKVVSSVDMEPAASYKAWNSDLQKIPVKITYTDGSTEVITDWKLTSSILNSNATGETQYVSAYECITSNADTLYLGQCPDGVWENCYTYSSWKPGNITWKVYLESDYTICDEEQITIEAPSITEVELTEGVYEKYNISSDKEAYYQFTATGENASSGIEVVNNGSNDMSVYVYYRNASTENWSMNRTSYIWAGEHRTINVTADLEYLFILISEKETAGTIGMYVNGTTASATVDVTTVDSLDYSVWARLPITVNFVGTDGTTSVGSQTIASWYGYYYPGYAYGETKYYEDIYYALYDGDEKIEVPVLDGEILEYIEELKEYGEEADEEINYLLQEFGFSGGKDGLVIPAGTYTVKVYLGNISEDTVIGTGTLKVTNSTACAEHIWDKGTVTKAATTSANGKLTKTCTECGETTTSTIYKISSVTLSTTSYTYNGESKKPTVTVKDSKGNKISSSYYEVSYASGRKNVGKYAVKVTFKGKYSGSETVYFTIKPKATKISSLTAGGRSVTVKWSKVTSQVSGYQIMYSTSSSFSSYKTVTVKGASSASKTISSLTAGKKYYVKIRTYKTVDDKNYYSSWSSVKSVTPNPVETSISSLTAGSKKFTVKWKKVTTQVTGYQIQYSTSSSFSSATTKTISSASTTSKSITGLKKGKKYYVRIRTYRKVSGKTYYSSWSTKKSVTVK